MPARKHQYEVRQGLSSWCQRLLGQTLVLVGPHIDAFEREFSQTVGSEHAAAISSGTAALHLALKLAEVTAGDEVFCSTFTFIASVSPITYLG
ncbi:MAG: DegT/DnrJ/EryC1/StrS family aminotransferase, partial [Cyanobacteria bacterium J06553_1]